MFLIPLLVAIEHWAYHFGNLLVYAGAGDQIASWEEDKSHSLFTKYFLKGMSVEADANKDSNVSWAELKDYLARTVTRFALRYYGREQTAQIVSGG